MEHFDNFFVKKKKKTGTWVEIAVVTNTKPSCL